MNPTTHLRFVLKGRHIPTKEEVEQFTKVHNSIRAIAVRELTKDGVRTLQQWWSKGDVHPSNEGCPGCIGEWRDVPLEIEG